MQSQTLNPGPQIPKNVIQDAFKKALDDMQLAPALDEENFQEARSMARHVLAPFEVPSEVRWPFEPQGGGLRVVGCGLGVEG